MIEGNANRDFEAEGDASDVIRGEQIKADKDRFAKALPHIRTKLQGSNAARQAVEAHAKSLGLPDEEKPMKKMKPMQPTADQTDDGDEGE